MADSQMEPSVVKYNRFILMFCFNSDSSDSCELYVKVYKDTETNIYEYIHKYGFMIFDISSAIEYTGRNNESMNRIIRSFVHEIDTSVHLRQLLFNE